MNKITKRLTALLVCVLLFVSCSIAITASATKTSIIAGDINGDGLVNNKDLTRLLKYLAGEEIVVVEKTLDTNGDGVVNNKDLTRLLKFLTGEDVALYPIDCTITFNANGGTLADSQTTKTVYFGQQIGELPVPVLDNYDFDGWYTDAIGGTQITGDVIVESLEDITLFAHWTAKSFALIYDANGGSVAPETKTLKFGDSFGTLPAPTRDYYVFDGWYTEADGGELVTAETTPSTAKDITIYAHWTIGETSDWVLADEMPEDAQIISEKWTYDLRTEITSDKNFVDGYTLYDTTSSWSEYGGWNGPVKEKPEETEAREVMPVPVEDRPSFTRYHYWIYRSNDHYTYGTYGYNGVCYNYTEIYLDSYEHKEPLVLVDAQNALYGEYRNSCGHSWCTRWFYGGATFMPAVTHTEYKYRERHLIYTYHHFKTDAMESLTEIIETDNINNVQKWVKYRAK